jgi:hypothetical protein
MDLIKLNIPSTFILERTRLSRREILYGVENDLLERAPVPGLVEELAGHEPQPESTIRDKWLYLVLAWVYEQQANFEEPLRTVEEIYADFGYPPHIASFVRYMPSDEPDLGRELNERRLYTKWKQYLDEASFSYATTPSNVT